MRQNLAIPCECQVKLFQNHDTVQESYAQTKSEVEETKGNQGTRKSME